MGTENYLFLHDHYIRDGKIEEKDMESHTHIKWILAKFFKLNGKEKDIFKIHPVFSDLTKAKYQFPPPQ